MQQGSKVPVWVVEKPLGAVMDAMLTAFKTLPATTTVDEAARHLANTHVSLLLLVDGDVLVGTVVPDDLPPTPAVGQLARDVAVLEGRTVAPDETLARAVEAMGRSGVRRLAVVDGDRRLLGLLCLKRSGGGFCTDAGVAARAAERFRD